ncbi:MAG: hypothetical protein AAGI67_03630 [Pseudomonadota bacterium]
MFGVTHRAGQRAGSGGAAGRRALLTLALLASTGANAAEKGCAQQLLVSGYSSDNVHSFDLCSGQFLRLLDTGGRLNGVQAVRRGNGYLYVASEENNRVLRYDETSLAFIDVFVETSAIGINKPTGLAVGPDGDLYIAGFTTSDVVRVDGESGSEKRRYSLAGQISGIDAGMVFDPTGRLLVPGFNSGNIVSLNVDTRAVSELIAAGSGGLASPRVIVNDAGGERLLVSSWGSGSVLSFGFDGTFIERLLLRNGPSGLVQEPSGTVLVVSDQQAQVVRHGADGTRQEVLIEAGQGGVLGATFLTLLGTEGDAPPASEADQAWLIGVGGFEGNTLVAEMVITDGAAFGADFDPAQVRRVPWGTLEFELTGCASASYRWSGLEAAYGSGAYDVQRVAPNLAQQQCETQGLAPAAAQGTWFGGGPRDGEGLLIDVLQSGDAVITLYSYRPSSG